MVGDIISERWAELSRNGWAASFRNHGRLAPESAPESSRSGQLYSSISAAGEAFALQLRWTPLMARSFVPKAAITYAALASWLRSLLVWSLRANSPK
jgi:hypothetical protein